MYKQKNSITSFQALKLKLFGKKSKSHKYEQLAMSEDSDSVSLDMSYKVDDLCLINIDNIDGMDSISELSVDDEDYIMPKKPKKNIFKRFVIFLKKKKNKKKQRKKLIALYKTF